MDNLPNRDRIRFMEIFEDFSVSKSKTPGYMMISKREFNPELSAFSNLLLDFVDFKDRVRPMANDITRLDVSRQYQPQTLEQIKERERILMESLGDYAAEPSYEALSASEKETLTIDEGNTDAEAEAATPDLKAAAVEQESPSAEEEAPSSTEENEGETSAKNNDDAGNKM